MQDHVGETDYILYHICEGLPKDTLQEAKHCHYLVAMAII